ncbi:hypothetical protein B0O79_1019 [Flavobacteriaceae bacterium MAR_2009_75]|nr:hypothetical protein B0O79_1019 [Flavobacteriaceae bacterium MAR_2009_75]
MNKIKECPKCKKDNLIDHIHCCQCGKKIVANKYKPGTFKSILHFVGEMIKKLWKGVLNNLYLILLSVSILYFLCYTIFIFNDEFLPSWEKKVFWLNFFKDIALLIFTAGIFTASLKYLQYIRVFETEFERILLSDKFSGKVKDSVESITFSEDFLLKQSNLSEIWETVTLSKYKQQFPNLYAELKKNINNTFFVNNNISYYYKHTKKKYDIKVVSGYKIHIMETTILSIVRPSTDEFEWDFKTSILEGHSENEKYPEICIESLSECGMIFDPEKNIEVEVKNENLIKECKLKLSGHKVYNIKRVLKFTQDIDKDREWVIGSDRIMDHLDVHVKYSEDLNVIFSKSNKAKFIKEELQEPNQISYISQELMLPGEKFKLFFLKV